jgi:L-rhamnose mutarotase
MKRYGQVIGIRAEAKERYKALHANAWAGVLAKIKECNIKNYSIYLYEDKLFSYYEYTGEDYEGDMKKMAADPLTQEWWAECGPCQEPLEDGGWWTEMEEVFHTD